MPIKELVPPAASVLPAEGARPLTTVLPLIPYSSSSPELAKGGRIVLSSFPSQTTKLPPC